VDHETSDQPFALDLLSHEALPLFNKQHEVGLHSHQQLRGGGAIKVSVYELRHFPSLKTKVPL